MIRGSAFSVTLHGLLLAAVLFGLPRFIDFAQDDPEDVQIPVTAVTPQQADDIDKAAARPLAEIETSAGGKSGLMTDAFNTETPQDRQTVLQSATASSDRIRSEEAKSDERTPPPDPTTERNAAAEERQSTAQQPVAQIAEQTLQSTAAAQAVQPPPTAPSYDQPQQTQSAKDEIAASNEASARATPRAPTSLLPPRAAALQQAPSQFSSQTDTVTTAQAVPVSARSSIPPETPQAIKKAPPSAAQLLANGDTAAQALAPLAAALPLIDETVGEIVAAQLRDEAAARAAAQSAPALQKSIERLQSAAEQGYAQAQFSLAEIYLTGDGRPRDVEKGLEYLQRASLNGYVPAQLLSATLAVEGSAVPRDLAEAQAWLVAAADKGSAQAADAMKRLEPQLTLRDNLRARQRRSQLRQIFVLSEPKNGEQLKPRPDDQLRIATTLGDVEAVYVQLTQGGDPNKPDQDGRTVSIEAAWRGYSKILDALIDKGADVSVVDGSGKTPLIWAAVNGQTAAVERLIAAKAPVDVQDLDGVTALMRAAWNGHTEVVRLLLQAKANSRLRDRGGKTALDYANQTRDAETIGLLQAASRS